VRLGDRAFFILQNVEGRILDVGAGQMHPWLISGLNMRPNVAVDLKDYDINLTWIKCKASKIPIEGFIIADAHNLPFRDKCFDSCVTGDILEHVEKPRRCIEEALRVSMKLIITVPNEKGHKSECKVYIIPDRVMLESWLNGYKYQIYEIETPFWNGFGVIVE